MDYVYTTFAGSIATIEFASEQANALSMELLQRLTKELDTLSTHEAVKVVVLRSKGEKAFCAGAFFNELVEVDSPESGQRFFSGFARVLCAIRNCQKPVIARAHGKAVGGGVGILATCDYVFATEAAAIRLPELSIGIGPFVIAPAIERKMGVGALAELSLTPDQWKNAYWAEKKGLYARVFENTTDLDKELGYFSDKLASYPLEALVEIKQMLWKGYPSWEPLLFDNASVTGRLALSPYTKDKLKPKHS
jgi:enoyl-coA hydratase/isomerase family protein